LNNNRGNNNNRRRGRGNRQGNSGGGGGQQLNRIDSRARGNAPQLLEKYRKLAQDAHLNGDRVQAEYYLQFADHYFRVLADARVRQEEQRTRAPGERWVESADEHEDSGDFGNASDFPSFDQPSYQRQQPREERPRREERDDRDGRDDRSEREERSEQDGNVAESSEGGGDANPFEPPENPFVRENRPRQQGLRPRRDRDDRPPRPRRDDAAGAEPRGLDPDLLPPAISASRDEPAASVDAGAEPAPRKPRARRKPSADDAGEALETVS
jgi:hypothetical protein